MIHLSARSRLTLLHTGLVLAAGVVLTALTYLLVRQNLAHRSTVVRVTTPGGPDLPPPALDPSELSRQLRAEALTTLLTQAGIALIVVTALAALLGRLVAGRVLRPIRAIATTARRLSAENLSERVPVRPPRDELAALATTVNEMLDRIQRGLAERDQALDSQRLFTANAAHELRTPLTTIRAAIEVTLDGEPTRAELLTMAHDVHAAADDSRRTIDGLLVLARSQAGVRSPQPVDLAAVTAAELAASAARLSAMDIRLTHDLGAAPVSGESVLLERMTANLVGNAIRHNHAGGTITVTTGTAADAAFLRVRNTGRTVAPADVDRLLEPFVRGGGTRTPTDGGAGLGLSIVRAVVTAHHGEITLSPHPDGGLDVVVRIPGFRPVPAPGAKLP